MKSQLIFVLKVLFLSLIISILVKYGGRYLPIEANNANALLGILVPALIMLGFFGWDSMRES